MNTERKRRRCAIYTRKSSEEGLEQSFNSLDAQREACAAFIESQRHEGWKAADARYDDGGFSGGSMDRPALNALLADIEASKIDIVVVYKVDRLTRSLADFAKIVERFDERGVSFVSVTQQFNTASSMGRLTLNVLLSFAQFEREVTGERIRDKIAASKKKGMWMGGRVPLGYDVKDRKLVVNDSEAVIVRGIFARYRKLGCVRKLEAELNAKGIISKRRVTKDGKTNGGAPYSRGALYSILQNRLYLGEVEHRGHVYPGEHTGIVDRKIWDRVQAQLQANTVAKRTGARAEEPSLLAGLAHDDKGYRLIPSHCTKGSKRYRYYFSQATLSPDGGKRGVRRIPALELEDLIRRRLAAFLGSKRELLDATATPEDGAAVRKELTVSGRERGNQISDGSAADCRKILLPMVARVSIAEDRADIYLHREGLRAVLSATGPKQLETLHPATTRKHLQSEEDCIQLRIDAKVRRCGSEIRLVIPPGDENAPPAQIDDALVKAIARGHVWCERLISGEADSLQSIAKELSVHQRYIGRILRTAFLAPDIVDAILEGRQPPLLTVEKLRLGVPALWTEQRKFYGFTQA